MMYVPIYVHVDSNTLTLIKYCNVSLPVNIGKSPLKPNAWRWKILQEEVTKY